MKINVLRKILAMTKLGLYGFLLQCFAISLLMASNTVAQQQSIYDVYLTVQIKDGKLVDAFKAIEDKTGFNFSYNDAVIAENEMVNLNFSSQSLGEILTELSKNTRLKFKRINENIHVSSKQIFDKAVSEEMTAGQAIAVSGKVTSAEDNSGLPGVNVMVKGTVHGTVTDVEGNFQLEVEGGDAVLVFSSVGFHSEEIQVGTQTVIDLTMMPDITALEEIVVVGYGTQQRGDLTGSISSVKGNDLKNVPANNLAEALQGRVAGIQITESNGRPGSGADIIIRGAGSINGTPPLYIIDGIRIGAGNNFNLQDIESVEVMKDASAAAIYGAQAAGGVILITTKRGKKSDKLNVNFNGRYGVRTPVGLYDLLETPDYITAKRSIGANDPLWDNPSTLPNTDWVDELFENGKEQNYNLSLGGGTDKANYYLGFNYQREDGIVINNYFERYSLRLNADYDLSNKITVGESLMAWRTKEKAPDSQGEPFRSTPTMLVKDPDNAATETGDWSKNPAGFSGGNQVANQYIRHNRETKYGLEGNVYLNWSILQGLDFRTTLGGQFTNDDYYHFNQFADWGSTTQPQQMVKELKNWQQYTANFVLTYQKTIEKHNFKLMGGYEAIKTTSDKLRGEAGQFPTVVSESFDIKLDASPQLTGGPGNGRFESIFGRLNYDFDGKYLLQATLRRDGSDKFGPDNKWGLFPSLSLGWRVSDEAFMSGVDFVNNLKLRASYGVLGNDNIGQFAYEPAFAKINVHSFNDQDEKAGYSSIKFPNQSIKWEEITTTDIGLDFSFLDKAFEFTFDWYKKNTTDMLYNVNIPLSSGYGRHNSNPTQVPVNIGEIENTGVEFSLNYNTKVNELQVNIGGNASFNSNKVISLGEGNVPINEGGAGLAYNGSMSRTEENYAMGSFYGYQVLGIFATDAEVTQLNDNAPGGFYQNSQTAAGDLYYADISGDGIINNDDRTIIGNPWPKAIYGLNLGLGYKGFEFNMLFTGVAGVDLFNANKAYAQTIYGDYNTTSEFFNASFYGNNGLTDQPRHGGLDASDKFLRDPNGNYSTPSSYFIEDGSYVKLKNLQLAYNLPQSVVSSVSMSSIKIYFTGQNLFTITGYSGRDPEIAGGVRSRGIDYFNAYPHTRLYSFGIELGF